MENLRSAAATAQERRRTNMAEQREKQEGEYKRHKPIAKRGDIYQYKLSI